MGKNLIKVTGFRIFDKDIMPKIDIIAEKEKRDRNKQVNYILEKYVNEYEATHGEIPLPDSEKN